MKLFTRLFVFNYLFLVIGVSAQVPLLDSLALEQADEFTNLDSALKSPENVVKLVLRKNKLNEFPKEIFFFPNLQYLDLSKNKIKEIPQEIVKMKNLQKLIISKNNLTSIPHEIGELVNLRELNASQNSIEYVPAEIGKLEKMTHLDLWSNNINKIPEEMELLKNLKYLDLRVILFSDEEQEQIKNLLPNTTIYFSPGCKCKQ